MVWPPPPPSSPSSDHSVIIGLSIALVILFFITCVRNMARQSGTGDVANTAEASADPAPQTVAVTVPWEPWNNDYEQPWQHLRIEGGDEGRPRHVSPAASLPSFTYNHSMKHNLTGPGDEAATCSVCLGAFENGETLRLLPLCLHLFHVECIDPWLDAHSTCPICRSGTDTDTTTDSRLHPPV